MQYISKCKKMTVALYLKDFFSIVPIVLNIKSLHAKELNIKYYINEMTGS